MKARWLFSLFCLLSVPTVTALGIKDEQNTCNNETAEIIVGHVHSVALFSTHPVPSVHVTLQWTGQSADVITQTEVVHALPGTDVTLVCIFPKLHTTHIIQTQWSKTDGSLSTEIAVYHPTYGTHYFRFSEAPHNFSVSLSTRRCCGRDDTQSLCAANPLATMSKCSRWALHLKNVTMSLSGEYECTFATYPYGTKAAKIQLIVKAEEEQHYLKIVWSSQTLEIPCLEDMTSENLSTDHLKWLVGENGRQEELVTKEPSCPAVYRNSSTLDGRAVSLGLNNALMVFPTKITDDGRVFSCHVLHHPKRVQKSSTTVRVLAYPEISISLQEGSAGTLQKPKVSCVVRKAFPKPSLLWYLDRASLTEQPGEISVVQEDLQDSEGFYELRSTLMLQGTHETHKTFSCACLFPFLGNETRNISSEEIFVSFDNKSNEASSEVFTTTVSDDFGNSALTSAVMTASEHQPTSVASLDFTSQANLAPGSITQGALTSTTQTKGYTSAPAFSETLTTAGNLSYSITDQTISVTRGKVFFTTSSLLNNTGDRRNTTVSRFPWPTVVAVLLLFCSSLVTLGIRKWCQYQKEIMNRPPSFKPPPPPVKYTSMVESDGTPPSCHELENL